MPVDVLLCEGASGGPDVRLLAAILRRPVVGEVRASGGKEGLRNLVQSLRLAERRPSICGLADGDFPRRPAEWAPPPPCREWLVAIDGVQTMLGWTWRRKEVENYFVDPEILARALRWDEPRKSAYVASLEQVMDRLAVATAARIALTEHAPRRTRLDTRMRIDAEDAQVRQALRERAAEHNEGARIDEAALLDSYERYLVECLPGGKFRAVALEVFAGKDILAKIQQTAGFAQELRRPDALVERVLLALERDTAPHSWLPEWAALRAAVLAWTPPG